MRLRRTWIVVALTALTLCLALSGAYAAKMSSPVLLTSAGQSPDVVMAKVLLGKTSATINMKQTAKEADLSGNKTLVVVIGASTKGLGAAGLDMNSEVQRVKKLVQAAKAAGLEIVAMHIGGSSRRGSDSNKLIEAVVPSADAVIVVADGNKDQIFNKNLRSGAQLFSVAKIADASKPLGELF